MKLLAVWVVGLLLVGVPAAGHAAIIAVGATDWTGSRSTATASQIVASDGWTSANGGFKIAWGITQSGTVYSYQYTLSNEAGTGLTKAVSHLLLEVSPSFAGTDIWNAKLNGIIDVTVAGPADYTSTSDGNSNPYLPGTLHGIKLDAGVGLSVYTFSSNKGPVWGDFYSKDGKQGGPPANPDRDVWATAWNFGIGTDPLATDTVFSKWVPTPDTFSGSPVIPEPGTLVIWSVGGLCAAAGAALSRRRKARAARRARWSDETRNAVFAVIRGDHA